MTIEAETKAPKVLIECPHLITVRMGQQLSCSMCGSVWGGSPFPDNWNERVQRAIAYENKKQHKVWRRMWRWLRTK